MEIKDFLAPDKKIKFTSSKPVEYEGKEYLVYLTNKRMIWYRRKGTFFKKDDFGSAMLNNIGDISYKEKGMIRKKGIIKISIGNKDLPFKGSNNTLRTIYEGIQTLLINKDFSKSNLENKYCSDCNLELPENANFCSRCGKSLE
jgi:ribosomal protein L40E